MLHCGSRQCGLQADAADPHVAAREGCGADGQEHDDAQGHPRASGKQPGSGEVGVFILPSRCPPPSSWRGTELQSDLLPSTSLCRLLPHIRGNVGFVFTKEDLTEIRDMLLANKVRENQVDWRDLTINLASEKQ